MFAKIDFEKFTKNSLIIIDNRNKFINRPTGRVGLLIER
jgi:hypothetical protein